MPKWKDFTPPGGGSPVKIVFYVPSKFNDGRDIDPALREDLLICARSFFCGRFGGVTRIEGEGTFVDDKTGQEHHENISLFVCFAKATDFKKYKWEINQMANSYAIEFNQTAVAVEVDNVYFEFKPSPSYRGDYAQRKATWQEFPNLAPVGFHRFLDPTKVKDYDKMPNVKSRRSSKK